MSPESIGVIRLTVDLQPNFALNQPLSPFALAVFELLDPESPTYPTRSTSISIIEATLDDPRPVISQQQFLARGEAVAAMKADGIEYDQRMELLEQITHPKPLEELLDATYEEYAKTQPWVADFEIKPKTVVRDMYERAMTFADYIGYYNLARSEGLVLRYLSDAFRAVRQTVPERPRAKTCSTSSSGSASSCGRSTRACSTSGSADQPAPSRSSRSCRLLRRRSSRTRARSRCSCATSCSAGCSSRRSRRCRSSTSSTRLRLGAALEALLHRARLDRHDGRDARSSAMLIIEEGAFQWTVQQILADPAGDHDWRIHPTVDLTASEEAGVAVVRITEVLRL